MVKLMNKALAVRNKIAEVKAKGGTQKDVAAWAIKALGMTSSAAGQYTKNNWDKVIVLVCPEQPLQELAPPKKEDIVTRSIGPIEFDEDYSIQLDSVELQDAISSIGLEHGMKSGDSIDFIDCGVGVDKWID